MLSQGSLAHVVTSNDMINILTGGINMTLDEMYEMLTEENKEKVNLFVARLTEEQRAAEQAPAVLA